MKKNLNTKSFENRQSKLLTLRKEVIQHAKNAHTKEATWDKRTEA